jgi:hypothetical protein
MSVRAAVVSPLETHPREPVGAAALTADHNLLVSGLNSLFRAILVERPSRPLVRPV